MTEAYEERWNAVYEHGVFRFPGVKRVVVTPTAIMVETDLPSTYRWTRDQVDAVLFMRPPWGLFRLYTVRLVAGDRPELFFGASSQIQRAFHAFDWPLEIHPPWSPRLLIPRRFRR